MTPVRHSYRMSTWVIICTAILSFSLAGAQTVSMIPHIAMPTTSTFTVYFYLDSDFQDVMGVEISLTFNETIVRLDGISAGDWFTSSGLDYFFWDYTTPGTDTIHFTGALLNQGQMANGVIGVCNFTVLGPGVSPVDFIDVDVRDSANQDYGAGHTTDDQIIIDVAISNETLSFGEIKTLYQ